MVKSPGRCIFCEGTGLTKEHVFPDWLNSVYPKRLYNKRERFRAFDPSKQADQVVFEFARIHQGGPANRKVRVVCSECNNGWMALLQERAKPVLIPLIRGDTCRVDPDVQRLTATWAAVMGSTAEYIERDAPPAIAPLDRDYLRCVPCAFDGAKAPCGKWRKRSIFYETRKRTHWGEYGNQGFDFVGSGGGTRTPDP